jgi:hypothetical protein
MVSTAGASFLPFPADDELTPDAVAALAAFEAEHPGPLSNLDRTLLASATVFQAYLGWFAVRDEVVPYLGERAVDLFSLAIARAYPAPYPVAFFEQSLRATGDDPASPVVTEAESLLLQWGAAIGADPSTIPAELTERVAQTFQPRLRHALVAFAGLMSSVCLFTVVGQVPPNQPPAE